MEIRRPGLCRIKAKLFLHIASSPFSGLTRCHMRQRIELIGSASKGQTVQDVIAEPVCRRCRKPRGRRIERRGRPCHYFRRKRRGDDPGEPWNSGGQSLDTLIRWRRGPTNHRAGQRTGYSRRYCNPALGAAAAMADLAPMTPRLDSAVAADPMEWSPPVSSRQNFLAQRPPPLLVQQPLALSPMIAGIQ